MMLLRSLVAFAVSTHSLAAQTAFRAPTQNPTGFQLEYGSGGYDQGLFTPVESLAYVSEDSFTQLSHPFFPKYSVRVKKSRFCDTTVNTYTGYIDIEAKHLFFYFFESRSDPSKDDVVFWTNGGPGCSSSVGLFMELGPCRILDEHGPKFHPESWNTNANVFFIDQPVGTGFSYAEYGERVTTTEEAAQDIAAFVAIWFENFKDFKGRNFHLSGESYGGRYLPVFAAAIYDQNPALIEAGLTPINLQSVLIGNGLTDIYSLMLSYYDMTCTGASVPPILSVQTCVGMKSALGRCEKAMKTSCEDTFDALNCGAAMMFCQATLAMPFIETDRNPYDISRPCDGTVDTTLCYPATSHISEYLSRPSTHTKLGIPWSLFKDGLLPKNFSTCSDVVGADFAKTLDPLSHTDLYVAALLERNIRVLIYVGDYDWICNWVGNERWTLALEWSGQEEFVKQPLREWKVEGSYAGKTRSAKGGLFTFATVAAAGHMVPYDKPKESLVMLQRWLAKEEL